jgi:hypothetical protein
VGWVERSETIALLRRHFRKVMGFTASRASKETFGGNEASVARIERSEIRGRVVVRIAHSLSSMRATLLNPDFAALNPGYGWKDLSALDRPTRPTIDRASANDDGFRCRSTHATGCKFGHVRNALKAAAGSKKATCR